ncbi:type II toxin-antitoxin system prevent-host-death family antitoxin, partial [Longimicrobium sp.]
MVVRLAAEEASQNLSALLCRVQHGGETVILEEGGKPMAAVIPLEQYEK